MAPEEPKKRQSRKRRQKPAEPAERVLPTLLPAEGLVTREMLVDALADLVLAALKQEAKKDAETQQGDAAGTT